MKLSQSMIKGWYKEQTDSGCLHRFKLKYLDGVKAPDDGDWTCLKKGLFFEQEVIGGTRDKETINIPKLVKGGPTTVEKDLLVLSEYAKDIITRLNIEILELQPTLETADRIGHPDAIMKFSKYDRCVLDLKYTDTKVDDRFNGWGDPQTMNHVQALDYVDLHYQVHGTYPAFFYLIFGKSGWVKLIQVLISPESITRHRSEVAWLLNELKTKKSYPATNSFNTCATCELMAVCDKRNKLPEVESIEI